MKTFIIAEAGVNHNGSLDMAIKLVEAAAKAGADAVKFQTFKAENVVTKKAEKAAYQNDNTGSGTQYDMVKVLELDYDVHVKIKIACENNNIEFLSTAFDSDSLDMLCGLGIRVIKVPSGEITNLPYLEKVASIGKPIILSTGMSTMDEVSAALQVLKEVKDITLLHCTTEYPAPFESSNLNAMKSLREKFNFKVGYSDHTVGIEIAVAAVALGASVIEKHFTLDKTLLGPDHKASLEPDELADMVRAIHNTEKAMGDGVKAAQAAEIPNIAVARRSIVAARYIAKGETFSSENLAVKRPGTGVSPMRWHEVIGLRAEKDFEEDELITL